MKTFETAIIGAGPAGIAAAIQLQRFGIETIIFERNNIGGLLLNANIVENYLGFPFGISGEKLVGLMERHLVKSRVLIRHEMIVNVEYDGSDFNIETGQSDYKSKTLVIASGTDPKYYNVPGLERTFGKMTFSVVHPIADKSNRRIAIVGAGDAAFDYALNLARKNQVTINNRSDRKVCLPLLWDRAKDNVNIEYHDNCILKSANPKNRQMELIWLRNGIEIRVVVDYLLLAVGRKPNLDYVGESLLARKSELEDKGLLHFIGDVLNGNFRQASIAAGQGIYAAMALHQKLNRKG